MFSFLKANYLGMQWMKHKIFSYPQFYNNKLVRAKMRPKEGAKIELLREICQILSDLSDLQV